MVIFRADGNPDIGSGHIMRCLSIASAGERQGEKCLFVTADDCFTDVICEKEHENIVLNTDYRDMLSDLAEMKKLLFVYRPTVLFVDSYFVSSAYLESLRETCHMVNCRLVYIDDILAFSYACDILLNYNIYGPDKEEEYKRLYRTAGMPLPRLLLGTAYAPLRSEFQNLPKRTIQKNVRNILISTGGSDPDHLAWKLIQCIAENKKRFQPFSFHFVIGAMNEDKAELEKLAASQDSVVLHYNVSFMEKLMSGCDLAISAAGSTLYELCATQTPTITYILADNQMPGAVGFEKQGVMHCAGDLRQLGKDLPEILLEEAVRLANDYEERVKITEKQSQIVDGRGVERIWESVICSGR